MEPEIRLGQHSEVIASIATPLMALLALRGIDVAPAFESTLTVIDAIVAARAALCLGQQPPGDA